MTDRQIKAHDLFKQGYNCAQAVLLAFDDVLVDYDRATLDKMSTAFGGGYAGTRNVCGAVSAFGMIIGLTYDYSGDVSADKSAVYKLTQGLIAKFTELNSNIICGSLLANIKDITYGYTPSERTAEYYAKRPCVKFVMDAAQIMEDYLVEKGIITL